MSYICQELKTILCPTLDADEKVKRLWGPYAYAEIGLANKYLNSSPHLTFTVRM